MGKLLALVFRVAFVKEAVTDFLLWLGHATGLSFSIGGFELKSKDLQPRNLRQNCEAELSIRGVAH
jgi:hypothetical protein